MRYYKFLTRFILIFIFLHLSISFCLRLFIKGKNEIFPIFTWSLFAKIPNKLVDYELKIISYDGEIFTSAEYLYQSDHFSRGVKSITNFKLIQKYGKAVKNKNQKNIKKYQQLINNIVFHDKEVKYVLVKRTFDPIKRWNTKLYDDLEIISSFSNLKNENS